MYHFSIAQGWFPPILGGLFGAGLVILFLPLLLSAVYIARRHPAAMRTPLFGIFLALMGWALFWLGVNVAIEPGHPAHMQLVTVLFQWTALACLGLLIPFYSTGFNRVTLMLWGLMILLVASTVDSTILMAVGSEAGAASYQGLARSMMLVSSFMVATTPRIGLRWTIAGASLVALFLIGARSELYGFIGAYGLLEFLLNRRSRVGQTMLVFALLAVGIAIAENLEFLGNSRQLQVLNLSESTSWNARSYMQEQALGQIASNPLLGRYGGHWELGQGDYAHSALSAWVSLGIPGVVLYLALCMFGTWISLRSLMTQPHSRVAQMAALMNVSTLILVVLAKPVFWEMPGLGWGLALAAAHELRLRQALNFPAVRVRLSPRPVARTQ
jgi:hypothetical protein